MESDDRDARPPAKGPRLNSDLQFSRYGANSRQDGLSSGSWNDRGDSRPQGGYRDGGGSPEMYRNGGHTNGRYQPPDQKRGICRDYHSEYLSMHKNRRTYTKQIMGIVPAVLYANSAMEKTPSSQANSFLP